MKRTYFTTFFSDRPEAARSLSRDITGFSPEQEADALREFLTCTSAKVFRVEETITPVVVPNLWASLQDGEWAPND